MKKIILTISLIGILLSSFGQTLITTDSKWYFDYNQGFVPDPVTVLATIEFEQDSIIDDLTVHVMKTSFIDVTNNSTINSYSNEFIHVDGSKVYRYVLGEFRLLYDLDAEVGDILTTYSEGCNIEGQSQVVESGTQEVNGEEFKFIRLETVEGSNVFYSGYIYERLGPIGHAGFFPIDNCYPDAQNFGLLRCYSDLELHYERDGLIGDCQMGYVGVEENTLPASFKIFPNPGDGIFTMQIDAVGINTVRVFDIFGREIMQENKQMIGLNKLDLSNFQSGIYFVEFTSIKGDQRTLKVIKQ